MAEVSAEPHPFSLRTISGAQIEVRPGSGAADAPVTLLAFFTTDCPTCQLTLPYLDRLAAELGGSARVLAISQDPPAATERFVRMLDLKLPVLLDSELEVTRQYDPQSVPTLLLLDSELNVIRSEVGFSKQAINEIAEAMASAAGVEPTVIAPEHDGAPAAKPGCGSRHLEEGLGTGELPASDAVYVKRGPRASRVEVPAGADIDDFCAAQGFGDFLPVIPPTAKRVDAMLAATDLPPEEVIALLPPNYGMATVEKIAANAVMAGCEPKMMRVLIPLIRAAADEKFNLHGAQATTHFAAPLILMNGPIPRELGFHGGRNLFSNVARANTTVGRAFQLILANIGGARSDGIDMSTLGNPGKFSFCIAENEAESPWEPFRITEGFTLEQSTLTLYACEPPVGVSEHMTREPERVMRALCHALEGVWTYTACIGFEALVVIGPEHAKTLAAGGLSKSDVRKFLFENSGVRIDAMAEGVEGAKFKMLYPRITIDGEERFQKFRSEQSIRIIVAGGTAGKFSAVLGSWVTGPIGSQLVTYPIE